MSAPRASECKLCGSVQRRVSMYLGVCARCVRRRSRAAQTRILAAHALSRLEFSLPARPPGNGGGVTCALCANECGLREGELGFCGLRTVRDGRLVHLAGTRRRGLLDWYRDPLPTNCVADWVCAGHRRPGMHNLAVFYRSCSANCLFCQNWHFRSASPLTDALTSASKLAAVANPGTFCVCFFGGDPAPQMPHALAVADALARRGVRICWETTGMMHPKLLEAAVNYSLESGGCIKFDLKAFDDHVHRALTGVSNRRTLENFARACERGHERPDQPLVVASTLLVPDYVDAEQVGKTAEYIASIDPEIPYALLAFAPHFYMSDLPHTSARDAWEAQAAARDAGLSNVRVGNRHLLRSE